MRKLALINLEGKFSLYTIMETQTYEPVFLKWSEEVLHSLTEYACVVYYEPKVSPETVKLIRQHLHFYNVRLIIYSDSLNVVEKRELLFAGADLVDLIPDRDTDFTTTLKISYGFFKNESDFQKDLLQPFKQAIDEIFQTMVAMQIECVGAYLSTLQFHFGEISGMMSLAGENKGAIIVTFNEAIAKQIISSIMAIDIEHIDEEIVRDGVGELVNMIAGGSKSRLSYSDAHFFLTTPTVVTGSQHRIIQHKDIPNVVLVYKLGDDYFAIQICMMALALKH